MHLIGVGMSPAFHSRRIQLKVLVINSGSSSLKYTLFDMADESVLCKGLVERIGLEGTNMTYQAHGQKFEAPLDIKKHSEALKSITAKMTDPEIGVIKSLSEIGAIGHRVLHGGMDFSEPTLVDEAVRGVDERFDTCGAPAREKFH